MCAVLSAFGGPAAARIPVFIGADAPLCSKSTSAAEWHGADGLGGTGLGAAAPRGAVVPGEHAACALLRRAREAPLSVLCLGPTTNLALALRLSGGAGEGEGPQLRHLLRRLVVMGGAYQAHGNVSPGAEFNVLEDPEAASAVCATRWGCGLDLVTWEATRAHGIMPPCLARWLRAGASRRGDFLSAVSAHLVAASVGFSPAMYKELGFFIPDPLAAAVAAAPGIVLESVTRGVLVETAGRWGRGMTVVDWGGQYALTEAPPVVRIIQRVDQARLEALLEGSVEG